MGDFPDTVRDILCELPLVGEEVTGVGPDALAETRSELASVSSFIGVDTSTEPMRLPLAELAHIRLTRGPMYLAKPRVQIRDSPTLVRQAIGTLHKPVSLLGLALPFTLVVALDRLEGSV